MKEKCYECGEGILENKKIDYVLYGIKLGKFDAQVCGVCKEIFFNEDTSEKMTKIAKEKGLWGLTTRTKVGQSGTTLDIRLPKSIINFLNLKKGEEVRIYPEDKRRIVIEKS